DLGLVLDAAKDVNMPVPMTAAAFQVVMMAVASGHGTIDDAAVVKVYEKFTGSKIGAKEDKV
ncbi:MAG: NAD-binding protein, partial [Geminicoccaceae bacterium]